MNLDDADFEQIAAWRRELHRNPEVSGQEVSTALRVRDFLAPTGPDQVLSDLGGHGVAAVFSGRESGPTLLIRSELDALPIEELTDVPHRSTATGVAHLCGHDGHSAILAAVARDLGRKRPERGRVVLLFQPAEETGAGAHAVVTDPRYSEIRPDMAFSMHNAPGLPFGHAGIAAGPFACASRGMRIMLRGKTAHASMPETGLSPMRAVARIMPALTDLGRGGPLDADFTMITITHARMGEPAFGVAPGYAEIFATLRTMTDAGMEKLREEAEALADEAAEVAGLDLEITYEDIFAASINAPQAVEVLRGALKAEGVPTSSEGVPMRASEDFGRIGQTAPAAMFLLGAGETHPSLHNPDYDFPDALTPIGARVFLRAIRDALGEE
ncbi:amidohydrolase [Microvirga sp. 2MCAF38]|uniref:amidohydrolase n=1 Tax=Microvirga sp. 2MCAF38 TaxID=3232989 RepID=UPI003F998FDE